MHKFIFVLNILRGSLCCSGLLTPCNPKGRASSVVRIDIPELSIGCRCQCLFLTENDMLTCLWIEEIYNRKENCVEQRPNYVESPSKILNSDRSDIDNDKVGDPV